MRPLKSQNNINTILLVESTLLNFLVLGSDMCFQAMFWHLLIMCLFVLICMLLWHPPCTKFVIPKVLMDEGICRSTADVQLVGYISDNNLSVHLTQSINSDYDVYHSWCGWTSGQSSSMTFVLPLWNLSTHWYTFLCIIQFSLFCANILLWISEGLPLLTT